MEGVNMKIITISREFGSGGREVGKRLAEVLGYDYYDREIISSLARETAFEENFIEKTLDNVVFPTFSLTFGRTFSTIGNTTVRGTTATNLLVKETKIIKKIAEKGKDFIIVGRNSDLLLKKYRPLNLFIYADMEYKVNRCLLHEKEDKKLSRKAMERKIKKVDDIRSKYRELLSDKAWGDKHNYHLCINTSNLAVKDLAFIIGEYSNFFFNSVRGDK